MTGWPRDGRVARYGNWPQDCRVSRDGGGVPRWRSGAKITKRAWGGRVDLRWQSGLEMAQWPRNVGVSQDGGMDPRWRNGPKMAERPPDGKAHTNMTVWPWDGRVAPKWPSGPKMAERPWDGREAHCYTYVSQVVWVKRTNLSINLLEVKCR